MAGFFLKLGGAREDRTPDLVIANDALSQLSYGPKGSAILAMRLRIANRSACDRRATARKASLRGPNARQAGAQLSRGRSRAGRGRSPGARMALVTT